MQWLSDIAERNTASDYLRAIIVFVASFSCIWFISRVFVKGHLKDLVARTKTNLDNLLTDVLSSSKPYLLLVVCIWLGSWALTLPPDLTVIVRRIALFSLILQGGFWVSGFICFSVARAHSLNGRSDAVAGGTLELLGKVARIVAWMLVALLLLENVGVNITALVAGLGIGGIAIALAVQRVLGDLLASVSIVLDKPFEIGDSISVGEFSGTVERIGIKTTRLKASTGEQMIFSNADLTSARIRNNRRMTERRNVFAIRVKTDTPTDKLLELKKAIERVITAIPGCECEYVRLRNIEKEGLVFEISYRLSTPDMARFLETQEAINIAILNAAASHQVVLA